MEEIQERLIEARVEVILSASDKWLAPVSPIAVAANQKTIA